MIATERVDAFSTAVRHLEGLAPAEGWWAMETRQRAGWIKMGERTDRLFQSQGFHMIFPDGFIDPEERKTAHPTWRCATEKPVTAQFGGSAGTTCASCGGVLHGLLKLDAEVCAHLGVGLPGLALVCCLSCLYWEQSGLFFAHDEHGHPNPLLATEEKATPQFLREPYQSTKVQLVPTPRRWARQHWGLADENQNLNRVGGAPTWVQDPCFPDCTKCGESMPFVAQLDTGLPMIDGKAHYWGSGGIGYIHWCEPCRISAVHLQCT